MFAAHSRTLCSQFPIDRGPRFAEELGKKAPVVSETAVTTSVMAAVSASQNTLWRDEEYAKSVSVDEREALAADWVLSMCKERKEFGYVVLACWTVPLEHSAVRPPSLIACS